MGNKNERWFATVLGIILAAQAFEGPVESAPAASQGLDGRNELGADATSSLILRGLDKISGEATNIVAPIGKQVTFATLQITARYCYSTPPSEPPQTVAFLQIDEDRPDQRPERVFSGWMWASNPGLNGMDHPLYDVWVISCRSSTPNKALSAVASIAQDKIH